MGWIEKWNSQARSRATADAPAPARDTREVTGRYASLYAYLKNRYANVVVLTFGQIEDLLGFALPDVARTHQEWWTTPDPHGTPPAYSDAWTLAGRTASPNLSARNVLCERTGES